MGPTSYQNFLTMALFFIEKCQKKGDKISENEKKSIVRGPKIVKYEKNTLYLYAFLHCLHFFMV